MGLEYPDTKRVDHFDDYHGNKIHDPYRYLEDPEDPATQKFVEENNKLVESFLDQTDIKWYSTELEKLLDYTKLTVPVKKEGRTFYSKNDGGNPQPTIYMREVDHHDENEVLDINDLSEDGTTASMIQDYSPKGHYMAMYLSIHGSDWQKILVYDIDAGEKMEILNWVTMNAIAWKEDESGFYYTKYPDQTDLPPEEQRRDAGLFFHQIGTEQEQDVLEFKPNSKEEGPTATLVGEGKYLVLSQSESTLPENKLYIRPEDGSDFLKIIDEYDGCSYQIIDVVDDIVYLLTSWNAKNNRIMKFSLDQSDRADWMEVVSEREHVITQARFAGKHLLLQYVENVKHTLRLFDTQGREVDSIELPYIGTIAAGQSYNPSIWSKYKSDTVFFGYTSFFHPLQIYKYDMQKRQLSIYLDHNLDLDTANLEIHQIFYNSKDGTAIPMYLIHKNTMELNSDNPTFLYGYGGYNISILPGYSTQGYLWARNGGVYSVANLRGGGEYGKSWHEQALLDKKQNVFDDFIAAAEWLIENKYTNPKKIAINGRSNGGLLVGASIVQRPDLFGAAIPQVGVLDMLRYPVQKDAGRYWTKEYGNALEYPDHYDFLIGYSPYHNIRKGTNYPPTLITAAESDDRVAPMHSKKFGAALQYAQEGEAPVLVRIETKAGHGYGKPQSKIIEDTAYNLAFLKKVVLEK